MCFLLKKHRSRVDSEQIRHIHGVESIGMSQKRTGSAKNGHHSGVESIEMSRERNKTDKMRPSLEGDSEQ